MLYFVILNIEDLILIGFTMKNIKNIFIIFISLLLIISCSQKITYPTSIKDSKTNVTEINTNYKRISTNDANYVKKMEKLYPAWNVKLNWFNPKDAKITVAEKRNMLRKLSLVKFMINTSEFEEKVLSTTMYSAVNASGPKGNIQVGSKLDSKRIMTVLKNRNYSVAIRKQNISGFAALGVLGKSLYCLADNVSQDTLWIAFPSVEYWVNNGYLLEPYLSAIVFHEILHNTGFSHSGNYGAIYPLQNIYKSLYNDKKWKEKYKERLEDFQYYYEIKYSEVLQKDSIK